VARAVLGRSGRITGQSTPPARRITRRCSTERARRVDRPTPGVEIERVEQALDRDRLVVGIGEEAIAVGEGEP
jgi:hypothetical protein